MIIVIDLSSSKHSDYYTIVTDWHQKLQIRPLLVFSLSLLLLDDSLLSFFKSGGNGGPGKATGS